MGIMPLISMVGGPIWGALGDITHRYRLILSIAILGAFVVALIIPTVVDLGSLLITVVLYAFLVAPIPALADSATLSMLGTKRELYGKIRVGGTLGFGLVSILAGIIIGKAGLNSMFWMYAGIMTIALISAQGLTFSRLERTTSFQAGLWSILKSRNWLIFLGMVLVAGTGMAVINTYFLVYMEEAGIPRSDMGFALALATAAEVPTMLFSDQLIRKFKTSGLMVIGLGFIGIRLLLLAFLPQPVPIFAFQIMHGLTFAAVWLAGIHYVVENAPPGLQATTQAIFSGVMMNLGGGLGNYLGGTLLDQYTAAQMYGMLGVGVLIGMAAFLWMGGVKHGHLAPG